ncbi:hypothetical protein [Halobaculum sp. MBLA0143]|uniref:hypothetical protein n=1 Tax=Halobaculum sp. MBLA0143 TaxID=3079933 RepID=UPI003523408D
MSDTDPDATTSTVGRSRGASHDARATVAGALLAAPLLLLLAPLAPVVAVVYVVWSRLQ